MKNDDIKRFIIRLNTTKASDKEAYDILQKYIRGSSVEHFFPSANAFVMMAIIAYDKMLTQNTDSKKAEELGKSELIKVIKKCIKEIWDEQSEINPLSIEEPDMT